MKYYYKGKDKMRIVQIEVLDDNYSYLLIDPATKTTAAIDPAGTSTTTATTTTIAIATIATIAITNCYNSSSILQ